MSSAQHAVLWMGFGLIAVHLLLGAGKGWSQVWGVLSNPSGESLLPSSTPAASPAKTAPASSPVNGTPQNSPVTMLWPPPG